MFANMELAWETLDSNIKEKITNRKAVHSSLGGAFFTDEYEAMESNGNHKEYTNEHPIVRTHPETRKKIFFFKWPFKKKKMVFHKYAISVALFEMGDAVGTRCAKICETLWG